MWSIYDGISLETSDIPNDFISYIPTLEQFGVIGRTEDKLCVKIPVLKKTDYDEMCALIKNATEEIKAVIGEEFTTFITSLKTPIPKHLTSVPELFRYMEATAYFVMSIVREVYNNGLHLKDVDYCCPPVVLVSAGSPAAVFSSLKYTQIRLPKVLNCYRLCCIIMMSNSIIHYSQFGGLVMFIEERHQKISDTIKANGKITIAEITSKYGISDESARRDLRLLEQKGICKRTHGGAISIGQVSVRPPVDRNFDNMPIFDNYREISRVAAGKIRENDTVYLTGGSFGHIMVSFLPRDIHYTVVVNSVDIGKELRSFENIDVYIAGGKMRQSGSLVDSLANEFVSRLHFDLCFITGAGLTAEFGLSNGTDETATFQRTVIKNSRSRCLVIPSSKIGVDSFIKVCDVDAFDSIITDWDCVEDQIAAIEERGVEITVVEEPK